MMKYIKFVALVLCFVTVADNINAQPQIKLRPNETILLYADSFEGNVDPVFAKEVKSAGFGMKEDNGLTGPERIRSNGALNNVSNLARVDIYLPKKGTGQMLAICPGGGYKGLTTYNGGLYTAEWLLSKGIAVAIAKYRMPIKKNLCKN